MKVEMSGEMGDSAAGGEQVPRIDGDDDQPILGPPDRLPMYRHAVVTGVGVNLPESFGRLVFMERDEPNRTLTIPVSLEQAGMISGLLQGIKPPRPMMGELFSEVMVAYDFGVAVVQISGIENGVYLAQITFTSATSKRPKMFPCRPSDGVILALSQPVPVPILIDEDLFNGE